MVNYAAFGFVTLIYVAYALLKVIRRVRDSFTIDLNRKRIVFVTSSDDVDGRKLVQTLDEKGFSVFAGCATKLGAEKIKHTCTDKVIPVLYDVTKADSIESACTFIGRNIPGDAGIWAVVLNTRVCGEPAMFEWTRDTESEHVIRVNLVNVVHWCRKLLPWIRRERGRVVMTTSYPAKGIPTWVDYDVVVGGIEAMYESLRQQFFNSGVTFHLVRLPFVNLKNTGKEHHMVLERFNGLNPALKAYYGEKFVDYVMNQAMRQSRPITEEAIKLYVGAVSQLFPRSLYAVELGWADWLLTLAPLAVTNRINQYSVPVVGCAPAAVQKQ